ncbi:MAG: hypothetical protein RR342_04205 [Bacilli bacterium]
MKFIFTPFVKFWNWIKETAWIQPLLIVGVVFAVIFSLSPIIGAIQGAKTDENATVAFYEGYKASLEGIITTKEDKSNAGQLFANMIAASTETGTKHDEAVKKLPAEKFFLTFVKKDCTGCTEAKQGFDVLQKNWNNDYYVPVDKAPFKMVTIFVDEAVTDATTKNTGFDALLTKYCNFFEIASSNINDTPYFLNGKIDASSLGIFESADSTAFLSPTICLIDYTNTGSNGVSELMFNVPGQKGETGDNAKARTLIDCWNGTGDFKLSNQ